MIYHFAGTHIISELYDIQTGLMVESIPKLIAIIKKSCEKNKINVLKDEHYIFDNGGYTLLFLLEESHLSIHTYIEYKAAFLDIFTCGNADSMNILNDIRIFYAPKNVNTKKIHRGIYLHEQ